MDKPRKYFNMRSNTVSGFLEMEPMSMHFSEWWSGDGVDFTFYKNDKEVKTISLGMDEMVAMFGAAMAMEMIDMDEVIQIASKLENSNG